MDLVVLVMVPKNRDVHVAIMEHGPLPTLHLSGPQVYYPSGASFTDQCRTSGEMLTEIENCKSSSLQLV